MIRALKTTCFLWLLALQLGVAQKPNIWIISDFTGSDGFKIATEDESQLNTTTDSDDHAALAMYLMKANLFNTVGIVLGSNRGGDRYDALTTFDRDFRPAYEVDVTCLNAEGFDYPPAESFRVMRAGTMKQLFDPEANYRDYDQLPASVQALVDELDKDDYTREQPLYVLSWGPLTETAVALKHLIENNKTDALARLHLVSHWTSSFIAQQQNPVDCFAGRVETEKYRVSNCRSDCEACDYLHEEAAKQGAAFRFTDLGAIGQRGIVNGSEAFFPEKFSGPSANRFKESELGKLFIQAKFRNGKPDGSDAATFYAILGTFGVQLSDFNDNGVLTASSESEANQTFYDNAADILEDLLQIIEVAAGDCRTTTGTDTPLQAAPRVFPNPVRDTLFLNDFSSQSPIQIFNNTGQRVATFRNTTTLDLSDLTPGVYFLKVEGYASARFVKQ